MRTNPVIALLALALGAYLAITVCQHDFSQTHQRDVPAAVHPLAR